MAKKGNRAGVTKLCRVCEKPHRQKTQLCATCNRKRRKYDITVGGIILLQKEHKDVWAFIESFPKGYWRKVGTRKNRNRARREKGEHLRKQEFFDKDLADTPYFVRQAIKKHPDRRFVGVTGTRENPTIHFVCKRCEEEHTFLYSEFDKGHDCNALKSKGEVVVESFLKEKGYAITTQRETLKCVNPKTQARLPYDVEVTGKKVLIEVQGEQHFKYIPYFHKDKEAFEYQQRKDSYKKRFAERKGYKVVWVDYKDIATGYYKKKINNALMKGANGIE